jgi:outer membrane lipase/esterase
MCNLIFILVTESRCISYGFEYTGLLSQVGYYLANFSTQISSSTLVTVLAGANDLFQGTDYDVAADNVAYALTHLANAGFQNFLVFNLPDIGATPQFSSGDPSIAAGATAWSQAFNMDLAANLLTLEQLYSGANFYTLDIYTLFNSASKNPEAYGFTDINDILWVDGLHPSTKGHTLIADYAMAAVREPASIVLLTLGMLGLAAIRRNLQK